MTLRALPADLEVRGRRVLVRLDLNAPMPGGALDAAGTDRLSASVPVVADLAARGAIVVVCSHLGEAKDASVVPTLRPIAEAFAAKLGRAVRWVPGDVVADRQVVADTLAGLVPGDIACLENLRANPGEVANDPAFAKALASLVDVFVNDAFAVCHRRHASVATVPALLPSCAGPLLQREVAVLETVVSAPRRPLVGMLGGAKLSTKLPVLRHLLALCDAVLVGGGMANALLAARGSDMGGSRPGVDELALAKELAWHPHLVVPSDVVVGGAGEPRVAMPDEVRADERAYDIGPVTRADFAARLADAAMVVWNGPLGYFERPPFGEGTAHVARVLDARAAAGCAVIVGGGETLTALQQFGAGATYAHRSTGGGAMLAFLAGEALPGLEALRT